MQMEAGKMNVGETPITCVVRGNPRVQVPAALL